MGRRVVCSTKQRADEERREEVVSSEEVASEAEILVQIR
jgi:hypothetical protein